MKMMDLGHTYETPKGIEAAEPETTKKDYPTIYLRGDQVPEKLPEGEFYACVKCRVAGMRNPSDGTKSLDLELLAMSKPMSGPMDMDEEETEIEIEFSGEKAAKAFRETMKRLMIGQSG